MDISTKPRPLDIVAKVPQNTLHKRINLFVGHLWDMWAWISTFVILYKIVVFDRKGPFKGLGNQNIGSVKI